MRRPGRNLLFVACAAVCMVAAVGSAVEGNWVAGVVLAAFGAALAALPAGDLLARRTGAPPHVEGDALVIPGSRAKQHLLRGAALGFAVLGALMAASPGSLVSPGESTTGPRVVGIICVLFFGVAGLASAVLSRGEYRIVLTPRELSWSLGVEPTSVAWEDVESVHTFDIRGTWFLAIDARGDAVRTPPRQRWLVRLNRGLFHSSAQIALQLFPVEPDQLAKLVSACAASPSLREHIASPEGVRWATGEDRLEAAPAGGGPPGRRPR